MAATKTFAADADDLGWEISEIAGSFHVSCFHPETALTGSGFSLEKETAKKKALSELNERYLVSQLKTNPSQKEIWGLNLDDSCSGFAVGYSQTKAVVRAVCEASERWALSQWIDNHFALELFTDSISTPVAKTIQRNFIDCTTYRRKVSVLIDGKILEVNIAVVLGWTSSGVFAGYGSKLSADEALEHAFVEVMRNFVIHKNQPARESFPYNRIHYFAENRKAALGSIEGRQHHAWPIPSFKMIKAESFGDLWLARAIFEGWRPWQEGSISRFLY